MENKNPRPPEDEIFNEFPATQKNHFSFNIFVISKQNWSKSYKKH